MRRRRESVRAGRGRVRGRLGGGEYPVATVILYGPDDRTATKIAVGVLEHPGAEAEIVGRWYGNALLEEDPHLVREIQELLRRRGVRMVVMNDQIFGCPHEEGVDFPEGKDCPKCPFWEGMQGTAAVDGDERVVSAISFPASRLEGAVSMLPFIKRLRERAVPLGR